MAIGRRGDSAGGFRRRVDDLRARGDPYSHQHHPEQPQGHTVDADAQRQRPARRQDADRPADHR
ncbi:hypothetical protein C6A85_10790, partial [Mycobacterium sp. ITM-2017-0098]